MGKKGRSRWFWLQLLAVSGALALVVGLGVVLFWIPRALISQHRLELSDKAAVIRERGSRPPILEDPLPGNAWDSYNTLASELADGPESVRSEIGNLDSSREAEGIDRIAQTLTKFDGTIKTARQSLHMGASLPQYSYVAGSLDNPLRYERESETIGALRKLASGLDRVGRPREALECLLAGMAMSQEMLGAGRELGEEYRSVEYEGAEVFRVMFAASRWSAGDLEFFAHALDRLERRRPTLSDFLAVQEVTERANVLEAIAGGRNLFDDLPFSTSQGRLFPKAWWTLNSEGLAQVRTLGSVRRFYRDLDTVAQHPSWQRGDVIEAAGRSWAHQHSVNCAKNYKSLGIGHYQAIIDLQRLMIRVATALAWYRAEKGSDPKALTDLVPRYLAEVPVSPVTGVPMVYSNEVLTAKGAPEWNAAGNAAAWTVKPAEKDARPR